MPEKLRKKEDWRINKLSEPVKVGLKSMAGRPLRGRLWDGGGKDVSIDPWPENTHYGQYCKGCGGLVVPTQEYMNIVGLKLNGRHVGVVTDDELKRFHPLDGHIFLGAGEHSGMLVKHLSRICEEAVEILGGIQQAPRATDPYDPTWGDTVDQGMEDVQDIASHLFFALTGSFPMMGTEATHGTQHDSSSVQGTEEEQQIPGPLAGIDTQQEE